MTDGVHTVRQARLPPPGGGVRSNSIASRREGSSREPPASRRPGCRAETQLREQVRASARVRTPSKEPAERAQEPRSWRARRFPAAGGSLLQIGPDSRTGLSAPEPGPRRGSIPVPIRDRLAPARSHRRQREVENCLFVLALRPGRASFPSRRPEQTTRSHAPDTDCVAAYLKGTRERSRAPSFLSRRGRVLQEFDDFPLTRRHRLLCRGDDRLDARIYCWITTRMLLSSYRLTRHDVSPTAPVSGCHPSCPGIGVGSPQTRRIPSSASSWLL
jgi:hypothetical protein